MIRLPDEKQAYRPWFEDTEPSRSVYEKFPASVTVRPVYRRNIAVSMGEIKLSVVDISHHIPPTLLPTKLGSATRSFNTPTTLLAPSESTSS